MLCRLLAVIVLSFGTLSGALAMGKKPPPTKDTTAPSVPANLTAKNLQTNAVDIQLAWNASTDNTAVTGYHVDRNGAQIATTATPGYTDTKAAPHANVTYSVSAFDASGNESAQSKTAMLFSGGPTSTGASGDHTFTPLHTYYLATAADGGSDSNSGTDITHPWLTPNHAVVCGDVILAKASTSYADNFQTWGAVSNCPSTLNGIDGTGGIYFVTLLCAGTFPGACAFTSSSLGAGEFAAFDVGRNNWSIQGWLCNTTTSAGTQNSCFIGDGRPGAQDAPFVHHIAFINNITTNSGMGFATADQGTGTIPGNGVDQWAVIGNIVQDSNSWTQCIGAIDDAGPANFDSSAGTHVLIAGNFVMNNQEKYGCAIGDGEGIFFDTWDAHNYTGTGVISDNVVWTAERFGIALFYQASHGAYGGSTIKIYNNTVYSVNNENNTSTDGDLGAINFNSTSTGWSWPTSAFNNIAYQPNATSTAGGNLYAMQVSNTTSATAFTIGGSGIENIFKGAQSSCNNPAGDCDPGFNVRADTTYTTIFSTSNFFGENPTFANASDLTTNWVGTPSCSGFANVAACMGWNFSTQTATTLTPVADIVASSTHSAGKGYLAPQTACLTSGQRFNDYPAYLKGVVYLQASGFVNGATITEKAGLINKPCNM